MNGMVIASGIGLITALGLSCIILDIIFPEICDTNVVQEPKPKQYSLQELYDDTYEEVDSYINDNE